MQQRPTIEAIITKTHVYFRGFTPALLCRGFDPYDDYMFFPMSIGIDDGFDGPDAILLEYDDGVETEVISSDYHSEFYGLRWSLEKWDERTGRKIAWKLIEDMRETFEGDADVVFKK